MFYAVYKNDEELLAVGTAKEVAKQLKIKVDSVYCMATDSWKKCKKNKIVAYKYED